MGARRLIGLGALALLSCNHTPPRPAPQPGAGCAEACEQLRALHCPEGEPTEGGAECESVCGNGMAERYELGCVTNLQSCGELEVCQRDL